MLEPLESGSWTQLLAAVATVLATLVALFKEKIIAWRYPPKLMLRARRTPPDIDHITFRYPMNIPPPGSEPIYGYADSYFLRLWVQNEGKSRAEKVQVFVSKLLRRAPDGSFDPMESFIPMNLRWSFGSERPTHAEVFADGISPGMGVHCNLAYIIDPDKIKIDHADATSGQTLMHLTTEMNPTNLCNVLAPEIYRLELLVAGANCRPRAYTVEISHTGKWFKEKEKMLREGVMMKIIDGPSKPRIEKSKKPDE